MGVKLFWGTLLVIWLALVVWGRGGFVHILLLSGLSILLIDLVSKYRGSSFGRRKRPAE